MRFLRGSVWFAEIPDIGDKPVVVVSGDSINIALENVVVARVTSIERGRTLPTFVELEAGEVAGLPQRSFIICHDLFTLPKACFGRHLGDLEPYKVFQLEQALKVTFAM